MIATVAGHHVAAIRRLVVHLWVGRLHARHGDRQPSLCNSVPNDQRSIEVNDQNIVAAGNPDSIGDPATITARYLQTLALIRAYVDGDRSGWQPCMPEDYTEAIHMVAIAAEMVARILRGHPNPHGVLGTLRGEILTYSERNN